MSASPVKTWATPEIISTIDETYQARSRMLEQIYQDRDTASDPSAFFLQPEALLIYDRLLDDRYETLQVWNTFFPSSELERVANNFGLSLN
jgi:hypothetical protein